MDDTIDNDAKAEAEKSDDVSANDEESSEASKDDSQKPNGSFGMEPCAAPSYEEFIEVSKVKSAEPLLETVTEESQKTAPSAAEPLTEAASESIADPANPLRTAHRFARSGRRAVAGQSCR